MGVFTIVVNISYNHGIKQKCMAKMLLVLIKKHSVKEYLRENKLNWSSSKKS
jgi:hypothetical protein